MRIEKLKSNIEKLDAKWQKAARGVAALLASLLVVSLLALFVSWGKFLAVGLILVAAATIAGMSVVIVDLLLRNKELLETSGADTHAALHDPLTGAANRRQFEEFLDELVAEKAPTHVLMMLDLDRFKPVNDLYGHAAGDELLKEISAGLAKIVSSRDLVARLGGDEFAIILNSTNRQVAEAVAVRALEFVTKYRLNWEGNRIRVGTSIGIVNIDKPGLVPSNLLAAADEALYAAKEAGRGAAFLAVPPSNPKDPHTFDRVDSGTATQDESAGSHEPEDGRRLELFGTIVACLGVEKPEPSDLRQGSRRRHEVQHWILTEPQTLGDENAPGMQIRELMDDATSRSDGGANLARWVLAKALNSAAHMNASEIDRIGFILPIPAQAIVTVDSLASDLMRMNALAHLPLRHITLLLYNIGSVYNAPEIEVFRQRLESSDVGLAFEVRSSSMDALAPLRYVQYKDLYLARELSRNLRPGTSGYAAVETLLISAEQSGTNVVASSVDTAEELKCLGQLGVDRFSGPLIAEPKPVQELLQDLKNDGDAQEPPLLQTGT